ncbi:MAG: hypothetical protein ACI9EW_004154 [Cellvibrionaceae bacterium]|jgi:hypothetical protein
MSRIEGVRTGGSLLARLTRLGSKIKLGKVVTPIYAQSLSRPVLWGIIQMDLSHDMVRAIPAHIVHLAEMRVATRVGCPF